MITESEFVMIKGFDRTLRENAKAASSTISRKNTLLTAADRIVMAQGQRIAALEAALATEQRKTKALSGQLQRFIDMH